MRIFQNLKNGKFKRIGLSDIGTVDDAVWIDLNSDRKLDVITTSATDGSNIMALGNGFCRFSLPFNTNNTAAFRGQVPLAPLLLADTDNDGREELVSPAISGESSPFAVLRTDFLSGVLRIRAITSGNGTAVGTVVDCFVAMLWNRDVPGECVPPVALRGC